VRNKLYIVAINPTKCDEQYRAGVVPLRRGVCPH